MWVAIRFARARALSHTNLIHWTILTAKHFHSTTSQSDTMLRVSEQFLIKKVVLDSNVHLKMLLANFELPDWTNATEADPSLHL